MAEQHLGAVDVTDPDRYRISTHYLTCDNTTNVGLNNPVGLEYRILGLTCGFSGARFGHAAI